MSVQKIEEKHHIKSYGGNDDDIDCDDIEGHDDECCQLALASLSDLVQSVTQMFYIALGKDGQGM